MYKNKSTYINGFTYVIIALIINMSVNIHDSRLGHPSSEPSNEIESLVELLMVSYDSTWVLPDTPDGADEDHIVNGFMKSSFFSDKSSSLLAYFPLSIYLYFPDLCSNYCYYQESPIPPPPIV